MIRSNTASCKRTFCIWSPYFTRSTQPQIADDSRKKPNLFYFGYFWKSPLLFWCLDFWYFVIYEFCVHFFINIECFYLILNAKDGSSWTVWSCQRRQGNTLSFLSLSNATFSIPRSEWLLQPPLPWNSNTKTRKGGKEMLPYKPCRKIEQYRVFAVDSIFHVTFWCVDEYMLNRTHIRQLSVL